MSGLTMFGYRTGRPARARWWIAAVVCLATVATGCGGNSSSDNVSATTTAGESSGTTAGPSSSSAETGARLAIIKTIEDAVPGEVHDLVNEINVNTTVRYAGFDVKVTDVLIGYDPAAFFVAQVNVKLTNRTPRDYQFASVVEIESQGFVAAIDRDATPKVAAGQTGTGHFSLRLDDSFTVDDAILTIGKPENNRVEIPLGSKGELISHIPVDLSVDQIEAVSDDVSTVTLTKLALSWDSPEPRAQAEADKAFLKVEYSLTSTVATALSDEVIELRLPSGTHITPEDASVESLDADQTKAGLFARFAIFDPPAGDYVLVYTERFGQSVIEVPITISDLTAK